MSAFPTYAELARVPFGVLCGLIEEIAGPAQAARYDHPWERHRAVLEATDLALREALGGRTPEVETATPPRWLSHAVRAQVPDLSTSWSQHGGFVEIRCWERLGLVTLPVDDAYVLAMIGGLDRRYGIVLDRAAVQRDHPDAWVGPQGHHIEVVDRAALLRDDPVLRERLWRVFEIEGGGEVSLANVDKFSGPGVTWRAVFLDLVADGTLDRERVLACCLDALQRDFAAFRAQWFSALYRDLRPTAGEAHGHQGRYRSLLRSGVGATVSLAARQLRAVSAADALDDDTADLAPGLLARTKGAALDVLRVLDDVARRRPDLHPLLGATVPTACEHPHVDVQRAAVALLVRLGIDPLAHADGLAPSLRAELGIAEAPTPPATPVGPPVATLVPVTPADLLDRTAALLEDAGDPLEIELVLAGLAACTDPDVLAPLRRRAEKMIRNGPGGWGDRSWLRGHLARLVLGGAADPLPVRGSRPAFLAARIDAVADVLGGRRAPGVLLATPDSADGFLDPARLVHRLARVDAPPVEDLVAALLRLGPGFVSLAGDDETAMVVRHAMGAPVPAAAPQDEALWSAAARTRHPGADDEFLLAAGWSAAGQGRPVQARGEITPPVVREGRVLRQLRFDLRIEHAAARPDSRQPMLGVDRPRYEEDLGEWVGWMLATSPHDVEPALTDLLLPVLEAAHLGGVVHDVTRVLDGLARHPGHLGHLGVVTLAAALTVQRPDQRILAVDTITTYAATGRLPAARLAAAMAELEPIAVPARWAGSLAGLAQAHPGPYVVDVLTALLPALPGDLRGVHTLVELLREQRPGAGITDPALRHWLRSLPGTGRAPRAARALLA